MKIRNGFVANSSSSSFCLYGCIISDVPSDRGGLDYEYGIEEYYNNVILGLPPWEMLPDETRNQFEQRVSNLVKECLGEEKVCDWYVDGGRDG